MSKNVMYFLCGTAITSPDMVDTVFTAGLYNRSNNLAATMMYVDATDDDIEEKVYDYGYDMVYVIRILKSTLMPEVLENGKLKDAPLPIWKLIDGRYYLSNELIYGVYSQKTDTFFMNGNYNEIFEPNGLLYDAQQEDYFKNHNLDDWIKFSNKRKKYEYQALFEKDFNQKTWEKFVTRHVKHNSESQVK